MIPVTLTRFEKSSRAFTNVDSYKACLSSEHDNCHSIESYMTGLIIQLHNHHDEPTGWSFAQWRKGTNIASNLVGANAIMLEYAMPRDDTAIVSRLHEKASELGWAFFLIDTETKSGNTISIVFPLTSQINPKQYARLASILAEQLDEYRMELGSLAATHIVQVHRTSTPVVFPGECLDPEREIKRTAKSYQRLNARKFEGSRPAGKAATQNTNEPQFVEDDLFSWPVTAAEQRAMDADALLRSIGVNL
ncbi:hypothetical protein [uncultured Novosphingobium sp.]|uniref:hypothetical protein n=1 Tax=uncultured Novosphingobium sp. TaxID=292277 RepID=UPI002587EF31|nr:hypothetical protein [uncultured Novosphingobium sp.]